MGWGGLLIHRVGVVAVDCEDGGPVYPGSQGGRKGGSEEVEGVGARVPLSVADLDCKTKLLWLRQSYQAL